MTLDDIWKEQKNAPTWCFELLDIHLQIGNLDSLEVRQFKLFYEKASIENPSWFLLLLALFLENHQGSVLLERENVLQQFSTLQDLKNTLLLLEFEKKATLLLEEEIEDYFASLQESIQIPSISEFEVELLLVPDFLLGASSAWVIEDDMGWSFERFFKAEKTLGGLLLERLKQAPRAHSNLLDLFQEVTKKQPLRRFINGSWNEIKLHSRQEMAVVVSAMQETAIISGGPGTGKTTVVAQILRLLARKSSTIARVAITAPTGRAAARLSESLHAQIDSIALPSSEDSSLLELEGQTLHSLLSYQRNSGEFLYGPTKKLPLDILIIDEVSMVDLSLFTRVLQALPRTCRLILLGDQDQLPSVDSGAVLGDLMGEFYKSSSKATLSSEMLDLLQEYVPSIKEETAKQHALRDHCVILTHSYRFANGIGELATAIQERNASKSSLLFQEKEDLKSESDFLLFLEYWENRYFDETKEDSWTNKHKRFQTALYSKKVLKRGLIPSELLPQAQDLFSSLSQQKILCPLRKGPRGVEDINASLKKRLKTKLDPYAKRTAKMFSGMPFLITQNDASLKLFNGDIGIWISYGSGRNKEYLALLQKGKNFEFLPEGLLPNWEAAFASTVHKAQGSEYKHVAFLWPERDVALLNKEILFTALTRAKDSFEWWGFQQSLLDICLQRSIYRKSRLQKQLLVK